MKVVNQRKNRSGSVTENVYKELRQAIITGSVPSGARLVESTLAAELNVSRTPIREALHRLALEGFLHVIPRAGYIVETISDNDVRDLFETRAEIEQVAVRWAIERMLPEEMNLLKDNLLRTHQAVKNNQTKQMIGLDTEFHQIIYRATRSKSLYSVCQSLSDHTLKFRIACIHIPEVSLRAREGHIRIYEAISNRNAEEANHAVIAHMETVQKDILESLDRLRHESFMKETSGLE